MQELVRWELEPLLIQHYATWSIGQVMLALGYITEEQITEVVVRQQGKSKSGLGDGHGGMYSFKRYGELALEMGYVTQTQLDDCLAKQAWLRVDSDDISCGWAAQETDGHADDQAHFRWLASGINRAVLKQWESAFSAQKVTLTDVYPLTGCAIGLIHSKEDVLLLESVHGLVSGARLQGGHILSIEENKKSLHTPLDACLESYHNLIAPEVQQIWLTSADEDAADLAKHFSDMAGREVNLLSGLGSQISAGMTAVATEVLLGTAHHRLAAISVRGPQPSMFQRVEVRAIAAGLIFVLIIGAVEASLFIRKELAQAEHTKIAAEKKEFDELVAKAQAKVDAVNKLKGDIKNKTDELSTINARYEFFAVELSNRSKFVKTFMEDLESSVSEEVVINSLTETPNLGIKVVAWSLSEKAAQQFIQSLKNAMAYAGLDLVDPIVRSQTGRLGLLGYDINFTLTDSKASEAAMPTIKSAGKNNKK
jgi:hypothetical protein